MKNCTLQDLTSNLGVHLEVLSYIIKNAPEFVSVSSENIADTDVFLNGFYKLAYDELYRVSSLLQKGNISEWI